MKQPKISDLTYDKKGTQMMRDQISRAKKIKVTIHFDTDMLSGTQNLTHDIKELYQIFVVAKEALMSKKIKIKADERSFFQIIANKVLKEALNSKKVKGYRENSPKKKKPSSM